MPSVAATATPAPSTAGASPSGPAPSAATISTTSRPSSSTPLPAITRAGQSARPGSGAAIPSSASRSSMYSLNEFDGERRPARRSTPLRSHSSPNSRSAVPMTTFSGPSGSRASTSGPITTTATASRTTAPAAPISASRQLRVEPTASTMASASSSSRPTASAAPRRVRTKAAVTTSPQHLLAPERRLRVAVVVLDRVVARALVHRLCLGLARARVEPDARVAERARPVLERLEQLPPESAPARLGRHVHPLDLGHAVLVALDPAARDRLAVLVDHDERPAGRREVGRRRAQPQPMPRGQLVERLHLGHHRLDEAHGDQAV